MLNGSDHEYILEYYNIEKLKEYALKANKIR